MKLQDFWCVVTVIRNIQNRKGTVEKCVSILETVENSYSEQRELTEEPLK
jgi:hypothetical protein